MAHSFICVIYIRCFQLCTPFNLIHIFRYICIYEYMSNQLPQIQNFQCNFVKKFEWIISCISLSRLSYAWYSFFFFIEVDFRRILTLFIIPFFLHCSPLTYACMLHLEFLLYYTCDGFIDIHTMIIASSHSWPFSERN